MRKAGKYYNSPTIQLGKVLTDGKVKVGDLLLQKEDYLLNCNLRLNADEKIYLHTEKNGNTPHEKRKTVDLSQGAMFLAMIQEQCLVLLQ